MIGANYPGHPYPGQGYPEYGGVTQYNQSADGAVTPAGAVAKETRTSKVGELSLSGQVTKQTNISVGAF